MKSNSLKFLTVAALVIAAGIDVRAEVLVDLKTYLKDQLAGADTMAKETFSLDAAQKQDLQKVVQDLSEDTFTFYYGKGKDGKIQKSCTIIAQTGKEGPMRVGACFDPQGKVLSATVLEFQESAARK
jgi:hypothetical protein